MGQLAFCNSLTLLLARSTLAVKHGFCCCVEGDPWIQVRGGLSPSF